jgi:hypothetical protein
MMSRNNKLWGWAFLLGILGWAIAPLVGLAFPGKNRPMSVAMTQLIELAFPGKDRLPAKSEPPIVSNASSWTIEVDPAVAEKLTFSDWQVEHFKERDGSIQSRFRVRVEAKVEGRYENVQAIIRPDGINRVIVRRIPILGPLQAGRPVDVRLSFGPEGKLKIRIAWTPPQPNREPLGPLGPIVQSQRSRFAPYAPLVYLEGVAIKVLMPDAADRVASCAA